MDIAVIKGWAGCAEKLGTPVKSRGGALVAKNFEKALKLLAVTTINITKVL
jgi:hypothetical protein